MSGELLVSEFLSEHFDGWEIYRQPHVNGKKPDFALLNPQIGLGIFEVKDWDLTSKDWPTYRNAIDQARGYGELFRPIFSPRHNGLLDFPVTVGLIFTRAPSSEVHKYFKDFLDGSLFTSLSGREELEANEVEKIFPLAFRRSPVRLTEDAANDLRSWLVEPHHAWEYRQSLDDDPRQRRFVRNADGVKLRRMRGSAGSGKSVTLVRRAAKVSAEGKKVLFVCYNNSLINYFKDICSRTGDAASTQIEWRTFHSYCRSLYSQFGLSKEFDELVAKSENWEEVIPSYILDRMASQTSHAPQFHAVYVDEGQDFNLSWWNVLRRCVTADGEMMIAFDTAQQIYPRTDWNADTLPGAGFAGKWIELGGSRRLPNRMLPVLRRFAERFHPKALESLPDESNSADCPCDVRWIQETPGNRIAACVKELARIIQRDTMPVTRSMSDLTLLSDRREDCIAAEDLLAKFGLAVTNAVKRDKTLERTAKQNFTMRTPRVKICTFQSFKGWQSRLIVVSLSKFAESDSAALYTTLTRLKAHHSGSNLTVVCSVPKLRQFGSTFPDFEERT